MVSSKKIAEIVIAYLENIDYEFEENMEPADVLAFVKKHVPHKPKKEGSEERAQCTKHTLKGTVCKSKEIAGTGACKRHTPSDGPVVEKKECEHVLQSGVHKGKKCEKKAAKEGNKCSSHMKKKKEKDEKESPIQENTPAPEEHEQELVL